MYPPFLPKNIVNEKKGVKGKANLKKVARFGNKPC